eukprot:c1953_g1_i1 orf=132-317(-)
MHISMDLSTASLGKTLYMFVLVDNCTRSTWVFLLKTKDEAFCHFCNWRTKVEKTIGLSSRL